MHEDSKRLYKQIEAGLKESPLVRVDVQAYADHHGVSVRTAQRHVAALDGQPIYETHRRVRDGNRYFMRPGAGPFASFFVDDKWRPLESNDTNDMNDTLYIYILITSKQGIHDNTQLPDNLNSNGVSSTTPETTGPATTIWYAETDGDFQALANAVCDVCRLSPILLLDEDEKLIAKLFKEGVRPEDLRARYSIRERPNFWWNKYWKGAQANARPTIKDLLGTWLESGDFRMKKHYSWPPNRDIQQTFISLLATYGRYKSSEAIAKLEEFGYDEILAKIPGGYYALLLMGEEKLRIAINVAISDIKREEEPSDITV